MTKRQAEAREISSLGVEVVRIEQLYKQEASVFIPDNGPVRILYISDLHFGDPSSDPHYTAEVFKELDKPHTFAVLGGDLIQGFNPTHPDMAAGVPRQDEQMLMMEAKLKQYSDQGKLIAAVSGNHEDWSDKHATINATFFMLRSLKSIDGNPLPLLNNGGLVTLEFENGGKYPIQLFHNPGSGGSFKNATGAQRARAMDTPVDDPKSPSQVFGGHKHSRAGISYELSINPITGEVISQTFSAGGTAQGINPEKPNTFLTNVAAAPSLRGLPATIIRPINGHIVTKSVWGLEPSADMLRSIRLWDQIQSRGLSSEIAEQIRQAVEMTTSTFQDSLSRQVERTLDGKEIKSRSFDVVRWEIATKLPTAVYFLGGLRLGSSTTNLPGAKEVMDEVESNPEAFAIIMRRMVDRGLSSRSDREIHLGNMVELIKPAGEQDKLLAFMLDSGLREAAWKREIRRAKDEEPFPSIMTGDFIQERVPNLPLIVNGSFVIPTVGNTEYRFWLRDKLGANGSTVNPFGGLEAQMAKLRVRTDIAAGGHMLKVGTATRPTRSENEVVMVAPGGFARWQEMSTANEERQAEGGQAVILYPDKKRILACATFADAKDTHKAVFFAEGIKFLDPKTRESIQRKIIRKRHK